MGTGARKRITHVKKSCRHVTATLESEKGNFPDDLARQTNSLHQLWVREIKWGTLKEGTLRLFFTFVCIHAPTLQRAVRTRTERHMDSRSENYRGQYEY